jgi:hypothetical protein
MTMDLQRQQVMFERLISTAATAQKRFAVTVIYDNIEVTVTVEEKKNLHTPLDLNNIRQLVSDYIRTTDSTDFDSVIDNIYYIVASLYSERDIEVMIYDTIECLAIMKIFKFNQPAI